MNKDSHYDSLPFHLSEIEHEYGNKVHILAEPFCQSVMARIGHPQTFLPELNHLMEFCYKTLLERAVSELFDREVIKSDTRMKEFTEAGVFWGQVVSPNSKAVCVDMARAGTWPSHTCFEQLHLILDPKNLRQDHFYLNRKTNEQGQVIGVDVSGSKIGGDVEGAYVLFPDPMGATGGSLSHCVDHYKKEVKGAAKKYIALHLIVTPEYLKRMTTDHPDVEIFALRLDRGLSSKEVLEAKPGHFWDQEKGLNDHQYIVPGAGGVGEILNNSFV